jgi:hypothetical protein
MRFEYFRKQPFSLSTRARLRAGAHLSALSLLLSLVLPILSGAQSQPPPGVPSLIHECEGSLCSDWAWNDGHFDGSWPNGAIATMTVQRSGDAFVIYRTDTPASFSAHMTAKYTGRISSEGDSIINGKVTWTWPSQAGYPRTGDWTAKWKCEPAPFADVRGSLYSQEQGNWCWAAVAETLMDNVPGGKDIEQCSQVENDRTSVAVLAKEMIFLLPAISHFR